MASRNKDSFARRTRGPGGPFRVHLAPHLMSSQAGYDIA